MRQIKTWTQYYVNWLTRLGIIRVSLLLALFIILMAVTIQMPLARPSTGSSPPSRFSVFSPPRLFAASV